MDKVLSLISSIETAIRYLLSGAVISFIFLLSVNNPKIIIEWGEANLLLAALCVLFAGFTAFSLYRLVLWVVGDAIAWKFKASAPAVYFVDGKSYARPYAKFLRWRHSDDLPQSLSGYLTYRWSVAHFAVVSGLSGLIAFFVAQGDSVITAHNRITLIISLFVAIFGFIQVAFLYRVEKELCHEGKQRSAQQDAPTDAPNSGAPLN